MAIENVKVPDLGDASEVEVIELLVSVGDRVEENDSLLVLESDKAAMEIPAPMGGVVKSIAVNLGDQVQSGHDMLTLEVEGDGADDGEGQDDGESAADKDKDEKKDKEKKDKKEGDKAAADKPDDAASAKQEESDKDAKKSSSGGTQVLKVPDLGTDDEVEIIEVHIKAGDEVEVDDSLITLESDKAAMEVPATAAGKIEEVLVAVGDKLKTGDSIAKISGAAQSESDEEDTQDEQGDQESDSGAKADSDDQQGRQAEDKSSSSGGQAQQATSQSKAPSAGGKVYAGPAVRKLARELGVDLTQVRGSGAKNRIVKEDIHEFVKSNLGAGGGAATAPGVPSIPDIDFSQFGEIEKVDRSKLEKLTAVNMQRNWSAIPHVAQFNEADVTDLEEFRADLKSEAEKRGTKLTFLPFLLKACARTLQEYPQFNVSLHSSGEYLIQKKYYHIGMAVATPAGLVVPVIRDVDKKSVWELAEEVLSLSKKARDRKLSREEMQGACFTISSLGPIGGTGFIPIINAPEVAILGVAKTTIKPVYIDGEFQPRKMLPFTLSYDHKAVNGVDGGQFADYLARLLGDIRHLAL